MEKLSYDKTENAKFIIRVLIANVNVNKYKNHLGRQFVTKHDRLGCVSHQGSQD